MSGSTGADTVSPTLAVVSPPNGYWYTQTVVFSGTVADNGGGSGVAAVEVSLDGGYTWLPATVDGAAWELTWEASEGQEFVSYPTRVRARDQAGNSTVVSLAFSIDNVPPVGPHVEEFAVKLGGLFEKDTPPGTHFDMPVPLEITWRKPMDGSGYVETLIAVDQVTDTVLLNIHNVLTTTVYTYPLSKSGKWYVHLAVRDKLGNQFTRHYGPWYVGTIAGGATSLADIVQTIVVDGEIDIDLAEEEYYRMGWEWIGYEYIDDFERIYEEGLTPEEALDWWGRQRLFTTWDGANICLGWMGAWWELDGTLWAYLGTQSGGCAEPVVPMSDTLPFDAEYAIEITSPNSGTLWACQASAWQTDTVTDWEFAQGGSGDTEIRLALDMPSIIDLQLIVFALNDDGQPWSVFPTNNPLFGDWTELYQWQPGATITPTLDQPVGTSVLMALDSLQAPQAAWCANSDLQYVMELKNQELYTVPAGLPLVFDVGPGLDFQSVEGADPTGDWQFDVPELAPGVEHPITITGKLASDMCNLVGSTSVSVSVSLPIISSLAQLNLSHRLDCEPPTVTVTTDPNKAIRPVYGSATDGGGSGVALVEYQIDGGEWHTTTGTLFWAADVELPAATTWQVHVRAWDQCGQTSGVTTVEFSDSIPPTTTLDTRRLEERPADLEGTASDLPSGGEVISVEVRIDDETAAWQPASVGAPGAGGVQDWQFAWDSPWDGATHTLWIRAADVAGNVSQAGPFEVYVAKGEAVGGYTESVATHGPLWLRIALLVAVVVVEVVVVAAALRRRREGQRRIVGH